MKRGIPVHCTAVSESRSIRALSLRSHLWSTWRSNGWRWGRRRVMFGLELLSSPKLSLATTWRRAAGLESSISLVYGKDSRVIETVVHQNHDYFCHGALLSVFSVRHSPCPPFSVFKSKRQRRLCFERFRDVKQTLLAFIWLNVTVSATIVFLNEVDLSIGWALYTVRETMA